MFEGDRQRFVPRNDKDMDKHCRSVMSFSSQRNANFCILHPEFLVIV